MNENEPEKKKEKKITTITTKAEIKTHKHTRETIRL